ncbi:MAG: flagellar hook-basal body complex protein, partial [Synergistaceae bacterium]|nr:flagellar hook-basal body complex protein [Synergistaceae bacterium]
GFFAIADEEGNTYYTREGNFTLDGAGNIITPNGMQLQGNGGGLSVGNARSININRRGQVIADGNVVGNLQIFNFERPTYLRHVGKNLLAVTPQSGEAEGVANPRFFEHALEMSNVSVVEEMVRMIEAQRAYEGASKALMTHDEQTSRLITSYSRG